MRRTIEDILLEAGLLDETRLRHARRYARHNDLCLARAVVEHAGVSEEELAAALATRLRLPRVDFARETVDQDAIREVPYNLADGRRLLPLAIDRAGPRLLIRVAMADPLDLDATEEIEMSTGCTIEPVVGRVTEIGDAVMRHYRGVITKMIPRHPLFGASGRPEQTTQPHRQVVDEASPEIAVRALVELLVDRGLIDRDTWLKTVRRLARERPEQ
jgi:hypothetical protein